MPVTINGIAKGAGMIAPDMATMLAFLFTDAAIEPGPLREILAPAAEVTFNAITIDGDTSTSDTLLAVRHGDGNSRGAPQHRARARSAACGLPRGPHRGVARSCASGGEGRGGGDEVRHGARHRRRDARSRAKAIALSIANSPLVKTAIAGEDPNWGRIVMAVGKAGEAADRDKLSISLGDIEVASEGEVAPAYRDELGANYMKRR